MCDGNSSLTSSDEVRALQPVTPANPEMQRTGNGSTLTTTSNYVASRRVQTVVGNNPGKEKPQQTVPPLVCNPELSFLKDLKSKHKFSLAFDHQNEVAANAIKSLDSLNDQIVQYIFGPAASDSGSGHGNVLDLPAPDLHPHSGGHGLGQSPSSAGFRDPCDDNLKTSIVLIRRLLLDAQSKFRKMVEENKQLALRIDGSLQTANHEVSALRAELADTNSRLLRMSTAAAPRPSQSSQPPSQCQPSLDRKPKEDRGLAVGDSSSGAGCCSSGGGSGGGGGEVQGGGRGGSRSQPSGAREDAAAYEAGDGGVGVNGGGSSGSNARRNNNGYNTNNNGSSSLCTNSNAAANSSLTASVPEEAFSKQQRQQRLPASPLLRVGVKETDIDGCSSCSGGSTDLLDGCGGGDGCGVVFQNGVSSNGGESRGSRESDLGGDEADASRTEVTSHRGGGGSGDAYGFAQAGSRVAGDSQLEANVSIITQLRNNNFRLENQVRTLVQEVTSLKSGGADGHPSYGEVKLELIQARQEHVRYKDALQAMKCDRKRLKAEKVDLLHQMKQLYVTLEDKESELRDFIRNYEIRVQESDETIKQLAMEKEDCEREKWEIIKRAREAAERSVLLRAQLDSREQTIRELQEENARLRQQLAERGLEEARGSNNTTPTPADDNGHEADDAAPRTPATASTASNDDYYSMSTSSATTATATSATPESLGSETGSCFTPDESFSGSVPGDTPSLSEQQANDSLSSLMKWMTFSNESSLDSEASKAGAKQKKKKSFGSLSKVFSRGRSRRSIALPHNESLFEDGSGTKLSQLTPDNYQEKLQTVEALKGQHMAQWRAGQVLAWLEINLSMPMYGRNCAVNVKSGKVLLGLSDSELGTALGITNPMHRRKLRLAIEEHRDPTAVKYPLAPNLDVTWVAHKLLPDLGLSQYSETFERNLVDGRLLHSLSRKDLERHFDIHRKFHQASILHAVELLRRIGFDREKLQERRAQCDDSDSDLIVWTAQRVMQWIRSIDLGEFADNLQESGVHGALMVLEPSFTPDTLATALTIPPSKSYIRRHLTTELETLLRPARAALDTPNNNSKHLDPAGKGHTFTRSYRGQTADDNTKGRLSFRGSLGRAFGKKIRDDLKLAFDSDSPKWKISAPIPIQHTTLQQPSFQNSATLARTLDNVVEIPGDSTAV